VNGLQTCFQAWVTNNECENWKHYHKFSNPVSERFPVALFVGKKEGDQVVLTIQGVPIVLTCRQLNYKYSENGCFEDLLYNLTQSFGGICSPSYFDPPLSKISQMSFIISAHENYARLSGFPIVEPSAFRHGTVYTKECRLESEKEPHLSPIEEEIKQLQQNNSHGLLYDAIACAYSYLWKWEGINGN